MCPTNSSQPQTSNIVEQTLCGIPVDSYLNKVQDGIKVHFCRATKGRIVWALATARLSLCELVRFLEPVYMWFTAGEGEISDPKEVLTFFGVLRHLCYLSHDGLDIFIPSWVKMVIRLAETLDKCARFRTLQNGMLDPKDEVLSQWQEDPEVAYVWLKNVNRQRKQAKKDAKDAGDHKRRNKCRHKSGERELEGRGLGRPISIVSTIPTEGTPEPSKQLHIRKVVKVAKDSFKDTPNMSDEARREAERGMVRVISPVVGRWFAKVEARKSWVDAVRAHQEAKAEVPRRSDSHLASLQAEVDRTYAVYQAAKFDRGVSQS
ncbi:hypothetical protein ColLi_12983 [Colletotrichum liriopes]|uniref:Uncharacterized protein n=1 Tax=Colletotrichum liriopes TaxID=708192 RepID=A0AA37LYB3_9PEZI|nr:hypothetical protein ColLi_12983 [Colletotrichum liriopes]